MQDDDVIQSAEEGQLPAPADEAVQDGAGPPEEDVPLPEPVQILDLWAVDGSSVRAIAGDNDLLPGETLVTGVRPHINDNQQLAAEYKTALLALATERIGPLQDAVDLDMATHEEAAQLLAWKKYRVLVNRMDISTAPDIDWPEQPAA